MSPSELELVDALSLAHNQSVFRQNPSSIAVQCAAQGSGNLIQSLAAGMLCFGDAHGPVEDTYDLLSDPRPAADKVAQILDSGRKVPGWGSSFISETGTSDPIWVPVRKCLMEHFEPNLWVMTQITQALHDRDVLILPNPSAYTAMTAILLQMPKRLAPYLLVAYRLSGWAELFLKETKG